MSWEDIGYYISPPEMDAFPDYVTSNMEVVLDGWYFSCVGAAIDYLRRSVGFSDDEAIFYIQLLVDDIPKHPWC